VFEKVGSCCFELFFEMDWIKHGDRRGMRQISIILSIYYKMRVTE
jgi:hypothetical protein